MSKHLFTECIKRYLSGRTRILATHQLQYIKEVDAIILIDHGGTHFFDNYQQLLREHPEYVQVIAAESEKDAAATDDSSLEKSSTRRRFSTSSTRVWTLRMYTDMRLMDIRLDCAFSSLKSRVSESGEMELEDDDDDPEGRMNVMEGTSKGVVQGSIFLRYFRSGANTCAASVVLFLFVLTQCFVSINDYYIKEL